jgi:hypothetical protein
MQFSQHTVATPAPATFVPAAHACSWSFSVGCCHVSYADGVSVTQLSLLFHAALCCVSQAHWPGSELRLVPGGHVSAFLLHQDAFRQALRDSLARVAAPPPPPQQQQQQQLQQLPPM